MRGISDTATGSAGSFGLGLPRRRSVGSRFWGVLLVALTATVAPAASASIGFVAGMEGQVDLLRSGQASWAAAVLDDEVDAGDAVRTGLGSAVKIVLIDDTTLVLGEDTELVIDNLLTGQAALEEPSILRQLRGQLRTRVGEAFGGTTRIEIHTPTAIMGVKGTEGTTRIDGLAPASVPGMIDGAGAPDPEEEISTVVRNWEGGITASMLEGAHWPVPPEQCRIVYIDRIGPPEACPDDFVPVTAPGPGPGPVARLEDDLLVGGLPGVAADMGGGVGDVVGESLLIEPPDPVIEDRTDADAFAGIDVDPLSGLDFGSEEVDSDRP